MDERLTIRMRLLTQQAIRIEGEQGLVVFPFYHKETRRFLLLPIEDHGTPAFTGAAVEATSNGFVFLGMIALCSADGQPFLSDERMPGASEEAMRAAKSLFEDQLLARGILKPDPTTTQIN